MGFFFSPNALIKVQIATRGAFLRDGVIPWDKLA